MSTVVSELELQRLVDGELSQAAQQDLLRRLDESPGGWRAVALAFVEQHVFADASQELAEERLPPKPAAAQPELRARRIHWPTVAAAVALGIGLGLFGGGLVPPHPSGAPETIVDADPEAVNPGGTIDEPEATEATQQQVVEPVPVMSLEFASSDSAEEVWTIPVYDPGDMSEDYWNVEDIVPPEVRSVFSREGYLLDHHREFYSVPLDDGSRVAVPVDTVQVRYAGL